MWSIYGLSVSVLPFCAVAICGTVRRHTVSVTSEHDSQTPQLVAEDIFAQSKIVV